MVGFVVPVLADNLLAYSLVLVSLHLEAKKASGETQQGWWSGEYV
jgi:hypothetical protein